MSDPARRWRRRRGRKKALRFWGSAAGDIVLLFTVFVAVMIGLPVAVALIVYALTF